MASLDLSVTDETWAALAWFCMIWFIFDFPADFIRSSVVRQVTETYSTNIGNIWLASMFKRFTGLPIGVFYGIGWGIIYVCLAIAAYFTWVNEGWDGAWTRLVLFMISIGVAALWFPFFYGFWPFSAVWSLGFIGGAFGTGLAACILMFLSDDKYHFVAGAMMIPYLAWLTVAFFTILFQPYVANGLYPCIPFYVIQKRGSYDWNHKTLRDLDALGSVPMVEDPWKISVLNSIPARDLLLTGEMHTRAENINPTKNEFFE